MSLREVLIESYSKNPIARGVLRAREEARRFYYIFLGIDYTSCIGSEFDLNGFPDCAQDVASRWRIKHYHRDERKDKRRLIGKIFDIIAG